MIDSLQTDGYGETEIGIKISDGNLFDTVYFTVQVQSLPDLTGQIKDIFDTALLAENAVVIIEENDYMHYDTTDSQGRYKIQLNSPVDMVTYYPVTIRHGDYTPFHTWVTVVPESRFNNPMQVSLTGREFSGKKNNRKQYPGTKRPTNFRELMGDKYLLSLTQHYEVVPSDFNWELYNVAFRGRPDCYISGYGRGNCQRGIAPDILVPEDTSYVGGQPLDIQIENFLDNIELVSSVNFNHRDISIDNTQVVEDFGSGIMDGEIGVKWDNDVSAGAYILIFRDDDGPEIIQTKIYLNVET